MHHRAKLSDEAVRQMRKDYKPYVFGYEKLAAKYGCGISTVRDLMTFRTRRNIR